MIRNSQYRQCVVNVDTDAIQRAFDKACECLRVAKQRVAVGNASWQHIDEFVQRARSMPHDTTYHLYFVMLWMLLDTEYLYAMLESETARVRNDSHEQLKNIMSRYLYGTQIHDGKPISVHTPASERSIGIVVCTACVHFALM